MKDWINNLPTDKKIALAIQFAKLALPIWDKYALKKKLTYRDSIVGIKHTIEKNLLLNTITAVESYLVSNDKHTLLQLYSSFQEPIVALQDDDWELPNEVCKTFYSVYNLLKGVLENKENTFGEESLYVCVNQAIEATDTAKLLSIEVIKTMLLAYEA